MVRPVTAALLDPTVLLELDRARMPFGKYEGRPLLQLPEGYLLWFMRQGLPRGKLGEQLALVLEIKTNGLEQLVATALAATR
jgi:uncharacterized protein (DUF3820 family)